MMSTRNLIAAVLAIGLVVTSGGIAQADLIGHWTFDEGAGTTAANGGTLGAAQNGTLGTTNNSITWLGGGDARIGGSALNFNALTKSSGDLVTIPHDPALNLPNGPFTLSYWYRNQGDTAGNWPGPFRKGNGAAQTGPGGWITFRAAGGSDTVVFKSRNQQPGVWGNATQGDWKHYVLTFDGTNSNVFYTNGTGTPNGSTWGDPITSTDPLQLGRADQWDRADLDDLAIWDEQISPAEARSLYTVPENLPLAYDAGDMQQLWNGMAQARRGRIINVAGTLWSYTKRLPGSSRTVGDAFVDGGTMYVALDSATKGLRSVAGPAIADSIADWSATGTQGANGWSYGYYDLTNDGDGTYVAADFTPFTNSGGPVSPGGNHWTGSMWDLEGAGAPWTSMSREGLHPNGTNNGAEHWPIRRWTADVTQPTAVALRWHTRKTNSSNDGVTGLLFVNGVQVDAKTIGGADVTGVVRTVYVNLSPGDVVDLALSPEGLTNRTDGSDGSANALYVDPNLPEGPLYNETGVILADTASEFSGVQGENGWRYGYFDVTEDVDFFFGDGQYTPAKFRQFTPDFWINGKWDWPTNGNPPWLEINQTSVHPNGTNHANPAQPEDDNEMIPIRRWSWDDDPDMVALGGSASVKISGYFKHMSPNGDGTEGIILLNGVELFSVVSKNAQNDFEVVADLQPGDVIDFLITPGPAGDDGADSTRYQFALELVDPFSPVPEPSSLALAFFALIGLAIVSRRRK